MSVNKPKRIYHRGWDKRGDIIAINGKWVTARLDGDKGVGCWELNSPFIKMLPRRKPISQKLT
jgi:hypothetical protein